jgi:hypothetical protein
MASLAPAAKSFQRTLSELGITGDEEELEDLALLGRRAALLATADVVWHKQLGPLLSSKQVRELMGRGTRQSVNELARRNRLLALPQSDGNLAFPVFQFGASGSRLPGLESILDEFAEAVETPYTVASWFVTPEPLLENRTPADWLRRRRSKARALEAAHRYADRLRR